MSPGCKVICIDDIIHNSEFIGIHFQNWVKEGDIYTVRDIFDNDDIAPTSITVEELVNKPIKMPLLGGIVREPAFLLSRFRKLEKHELEAIAEEEVNSKLQVDELQAIEELIK